MHDTVAELTLCNTMCAEIARRIDLEALWLGIVHERGWERRARFPATRRQRQSALDRVILVGRATKVRLIGLW